MSTGERRGDPDGRLIAARQAETLAEAGRVAHALGVLLRRAGVDDATGIASLTANISSLEADALMRAHGRIEGRQRFKRAAGRGAPAHEGRDVVRLSVDESGLSFVSRQGHEGWFALGAVAMTSEDERAYCAHADELKRQFFTAPHEITFHEPLMRQRAGPFRFGGDRVRWRRFDDAVDDLIAASGFVAFAVGVRKRAFAQDFREAGRDPYLPMDAYSLALQLLLERFVDHLHTQESYPLGALVLEAQGPRENADHQLAVAETLVHGTQWISESAFRRYVEPGVSFVPKQGSHPVELSDMLARDVLSGFAQIARSSPGGGRRGATSSIAAAIFGWASSG